MITTSFDYNGSQLERGLETFDNRLHRAIEATFTRGANQIEADMKAHAPWTDRTSLARTSLYARYQRRGKNHSIVIGGSAPYQIYLETSNGGKYAIIGPTVQAAQPRIMGTLNRLIDRL